MTQVTLEFVSEQLAQLLAVVQRNTSDLQALREQHGRMEGNLQALRGQQERDRQAVQERFAALEAKIDDVTGGGKISLAFLSKQVERVSSDIADLKIDMEVLSAIVRRFDQHALVGEVRALTGQQDRQRQKLDRLQKQLDELERGQPAPS